MTDLMKPESLPSSLYWSTTYLNPQRFSSIGYQWKIAMESGGESFLEIGPGAGVLTLLLRAKGFTVITGDINTLLKPSVCLNLPFLPFRKKAFDVVLCFEVLEHIPLDLLLPSLKEYERVASSKVVISLPEYKPKKRSLRRWSIPWAAYQFQKLIPSMPRIRARDETVTISPGHYWEIGVQGVSRETVIAQGQQAGLLFKEDFCNPHYSYHHFFAFETS